MVDRKGTLKKIKRAIDIIQANPIYNQIVIDALELVPVAGSVLSKYWSKYKESNETDPRDDILETLKIMQNMDEKRLEDFSKMLEHNATIILQNQKKLNELVSYQKEILGEIQEVKNNTHEIKRSVQINQELLNKLVESVKKIQDKLGVTEIIEPNKKIKIPQDDLVEIKKKDEEIDRIATELENANQKPVIDFDYLLREGNLYFHNKQYEKAIGFYDSILKIVPNHILALNNKGMVLWYLENYSESLELYDKILAIDPNDVLALNNKGFTLHNLGRYEEAIELYDRALAVDPNDILALTSKGIVLYKMGKKMSLRNWLTRHAVLIQSNLNCYLPTLRLHKAWEKIETP